MGGRTNQKAVCFSATASRAGDAVVSPSGFVVTARRADVRTDHRATNCAATGTTCRSDGTAGLDVTNYGTDPTCRANGATGFDLKACRSDDAAFSRAWRIPARRAASERRN